jgi:hypothetical protein
MTAVLFQNPSLKAQNELFKTTNGKKEMKYQIGQVVSYLMGDEMGYSASSVPATILNANIDENDDEVYTVQIRETGDFWDGVSTDALE